MNWKLESRFYLRYADDITLMAESEEELKSVLIRVKKEREKAGLKLNVKKRMIMALGPITSRQIEGEKVEAVTDFIFLGFKTTADGDCSYEIKTLDPWKESYGKPRQPIKKAKTSLCQQRSIYSKLWFFQ